MNDVETALKSLLEAKAGEVSRLVGDPLVAVTRRAKAKRRRQRLVAITSTVAFVLGGVAGAAALHQSGRETGLPVSSQSPSATGPSVMPPARLGPMSSLDDLRRFLESDHVFLSKGAPASFGGTVYCGLDLLGRSADGRYAYLWALCEEYYVDGGALKAGSASSLPVRVDTVHAAVAVPGSGSRYGKDVRRLFPAALADRVLTSPPPTDEGEAELQARARAGLLPAPTTCGTSMKVVVSAPGQGPRPLPANASLSVTVRVGEQVSVIFDGDCPAGFSLAVNGTSPSQEYSAQGLPGKGSVAQGWQPMAAGKRTLLVMWICPYPGSTCPPGVLGSIVVTTPAG